MSKSFEVLRLSVIQSSFGFSDVESITIPATSFVDNLRFLGAVKTIFVRKERLKTEFTRRPGSGDTCHLSFLDETLPD